MWNTSSPDPYQWWDELCCKATSILSLQQSPASIIGPVLQKMIIKNTTSVQENKDYKQHLFI